MVRTGGIFASVSCLRQKPAYSLNPVAAGRRVHLFNEPLKLERR
jgi:hypothetical protein